MFLVDGKLQGFNVTDFFFVPFSTTLVKPNSFMQTFQGLVPNTINYVNKDMAYDVTYKDLVQLPK